MSNQQALASAYAEKDEAKKHVETVKTQLKNAKKQKQKEKVKQLSESLILAQKRVARAQMLTRTLKAAQKKQKKMAKKKKEKTKGTIAKSQREDPLSRTDFYLGKTGMYRSRRN